MQLQTIEDKLTRLKQQLRAANLNTPQAIIRQRDALHLCDQLDELFNDNELSHHQPLTQFKELLKNRWHNVQGTYLCYTATPQSPATDICCDIANYLAEHNGDKALSYLMPSVKHALHPVMYDNINEHDIRELIRSCILSDDTNYLIPVDLLGFLSCDNEDNLHQALNETLQYLDVNNNLRPLTSHEQHRLMNHSALTQKLMGAMESFEKAKQSEHSLYTILLDLQKAFIRASRGNIERATESEAGQSATEGLVTFRNHCNALANMELILTQQAPNPSEVNNALQPNPRRVYLIKTTQSTYQIGFEDSEGQYQQQKLTRDEVTGSGYLIEALDHLPSEYFNGEPYTGTLLSKPQIGHIISRTQVSHVFENDFFAEPFYHTHLVNPINRAFYAYDYCVAQEAEALKALLEKHGDELGDLGFVPDQDGNPPLVNHYRGEFNKYRYELNSELDDNNTDHKPYKGQDPLRLTMEQIHSIDPDYINNSDDVLFILEGLTPDEIETATSIFDQRMRRALTDISDLAVVLSGLNSPQIERFISSLNCLSNIINQQDLPNLARLLPDDKAGSLLKMTGPQFIEDGQDFQEILEVLNQNPQDKLIDSLVHQERLTSIIKDLFDLKNTLETLNDNLRSHFLEQVDQHIGLTSLIQNGVDLQNMLEGLDPNPQEQLLDKLAQQEHLTSIIKNPYDLTGTLKTLSGNLRDHCLEQVDQHIGLTSLIKNRVDLQNTLEALDQNGRKYLLDCLSQQGHLTSIVEKPKDLRDVLKVLYKDNRQLLLSALETKKPLASIIRSSGDLRNTLEFLDQVRRKDLLKKLINQRRLTSIVEKPKGLRDVLEVLYKDNRQLLLSALETKKPLASIIRSSDDLRNTLEFLDHVRRKDLLKKLVNQRRLTSIIEKHEDLTAVLKVLDEDNRQHLLDGLLQQKRTISSIKNSFGLKDRRLTSIIRDSFGLEPTLNVLGTEYLRAHLLTKLDNEGRLTSMITNSGDLHFALKYSPTIWQKHLLKSLLDEKRLTSVIGHDAYSLRTVLKAGLPQSQAYLLETLQHQGHLQSIFTNLLKTPPVLEVLDEDCQKQLLNSTAYQKLLTSITPYDLLQNLIVLKRNSQGYVLKQIDRYIGLASLFKGGPDPLNPPDVFSGILFNIASHGYLNAIITKPDDLQKTLKFLDQNGQKQLLKSLAESQELLEKIINGLDALIETLDLLSPNQKDYLLDQLIEKEYLTEIINSPNDLQKTLEVLHQNGQKHLLSKLAQNYSEHQNQPSYTETKPVLAFDIMKPDSTIPQALYPDALTDFVNTAKCLSGDNFKQSNYSRNRPPKAAINWVEATVAKHFFQCWGQLINTTDEQVDPADMVQSELAALKDELSNVRHQFTSQNNRTQEAASATNLQRYSLFTTGNNHETNPLDELASWLESTLQDKSEHADQAEHANQAKHATVKATTCCNIQ